MKLVVVAWAQAGPVSAAAATVAPSISVIRLTLIAPSVTLLVVVALTEG
jgi:hypothetical protein